MDIRRTPSSFQMPQGDRLRSLAEGVAHHLGTPLSVVLGRAEMILAGEVTGQEATESVEAIWTKAEEMRHVIDALLELGRRQPLRRSLIDVRDLLGHTVTLLEPRARSAEVELLLIERAPEPLMAWLDPARIQQALSNVITNAVEATQGERGVVELEAGVAGEAEELSWVTLSIRDQGVGIGEELLPHIFDPFFTTKPVGAGLGLGLTTAAAFVADHGGSIAVESHPGRGARFVISLPLRDS